MLKKKVWRIVIFIQVGLCFCPAIPEVVDCNDPEAFSFQRGSCYYPLSSEPCEEGEWAVVTSLNMLACQPLPCEPSKVLFNGKCIHMYDTLACPAVGERLFVNKYGEGVCDCDDGWGRGEDGRCYQEFTRGFCQENSIIRIRQEEGECKARAKEGSNKPCAFPFILDNQIHTACAAGRWPETLSEEVRGSPWCPTEVDENLAMIGNNWGLCDQNCEIDAGENHIVFSDKFRKLNRQLGRRHSQALHKDLIKCESNPCGDPRISLPHTSTWNTSNLVCHQLTHKSCLSDDCEVTVAQDQTLKCCPHEERISCALEDSFNTFSVANTCLGKASCACRRRYVFSKYRQRCVRLYRG